MKRFIEGESRNQSTLFPELLDDYVGEDNPVRVIDVFVDELDLGGLGFSGVEPHATGRPAYHPAILLKLYIYGYLNRIQSSRRLERESQRNVEVMWLTSRLMPDFKTVADFRKNNGKAIRSVCREFVVLCRNLNLFADAVVAIDGSKFKAVNARDKNFTQAKMKHRMEQLEKSIDQYLKQLDRADRKAPPQDSATELQNKISKLKDEMQRLKKLKAVMLEHPDKQVSLTDPDSRSMVTGGKGMVGYNVQTAVDTEHHLIVTHEVTNTGNDKNQLFAMAKQARLSMGVDKLEVLADRGYYKGEEILACDEADITSYVPKPLTSGSKANGRFTKQEFHYLTDTDEYLCPADQRLVWHPTVKENGRAMRCYWNTAACKGCSIKAQCTPSKERRIKRWEHEAAVDAMQQRLERKPDAMQIRKETVEHPFGTIKAWMGATHFLTKTVHHVSTEMSLHVLAYNLKRVMNIMGVKPLMEAIRA
ncbi:MAG TPA: IS1182 family transposase [Mariprofundaceae bacterium]|nr:IS1182 family transposase [Mariprofundaceae bacterium]